MNPTKFKYFHYFIALICFDWLLVLGVGFLLEVTQLYFLIGIWIAANFINYPRIASRRFISYYKVFTLTIKQFALFITFWTLSLILIPSLHLDNQLYSPLIILVVFISRLVFVFVLRLYRIVGRGYNRYYIIGNSPGINNIKVEFLSKKSHGYIFAGQADTIDFEFLKNLVLNKQLHEIYCSAQSVNQDQLSQLLSLAMHYGVNVHVVSDLVKNSTSDNSDSGSPLFYSKIDLEDFPLIDRKNLIIKRLFDIIFSAIVIITLLWWISIILGILIKLESKGPVFFRQPRAGREGKYFMCYKFRSMIVSGIEKQATKDDNRITKVGRFIRKTSIDELPQFVNVFLSQMSVVGPRPHIKLLNDKYATKINNYDGRMLVKPGITGLSQISGLRGETAENSTMANRVKVDMLYIKNWSLATDFSIIGKTTYDLLFLKNREVF